jgi:SAM-dependent methyltransferase
VCSGRYGEVFFAVDRQPVLISALWSDADSARACRRGDIELAFCADCGFVWNVRFDPGLIEYDEQYDNSLHFSQTFQAYSQNLVERLVETYDLRNKTIVDIGCGKGNFLTMLCETGENSGFGFDPSYEGERPQSKTAKRITWSNEYYSEEHARIAADLISSRYVYEHIPNPNQFLRMVRRSITGPARAVVFFEVPNIDLIIRQGSVWDVIYEHCSYFGPESLSRSFFECGFEVLRLEETFGHQFLTVDARARTDDGIADVQEFGNLAKLKNDIGTFAKAQLEKQEAWRKRLAEWRQEHRRVVAWGAGAKAVGFLNMMQDDEVVTRVVDINPFKQGRYLSGTGQRIVAPEGLVNEPPDIVLMMNPIYRDEIASSLAGLGLSPELVAA